MLETLKNQKLKKTIKRSIKNFFKLEKKANLCRQIGFSFLEFLAIMDYGRFFACPR